MKTQKAIDLAGSVLKLAHLMEVSAQSVYTWKEAGDLPPLRIYQLKALKPEWFKEKKAAKKVAAKGRK
jgi:hypothetical protein